MHYNSRKENKFKKPVKKALKFSIESSYVTNKLTGLQYLELHLQN